MPISLSTDTLNATCFLQCTDMLLNYAPSRTKSVRQNLLRNIGVFFQNLYDPKHHCTFQSTIVPGALVLWNFRLIYKRTFQRLKPDPQCSTCKLIYRKLRTYVLAFITYVLPACFLRFRTYLKSPVGSALVFNVVCNIDPI